MSVTTTDRFAALAARLEPTALGAVGLLATVAALAITAGPLGGLLGIALAVVGLVAPPLAVFGLGQAVLLTVLPAPTFTQLLLVEAALFVVLVGPATRSATGRLLAVSGGLFAVFAVAVWVGVDTGGLRATATGLVVAVSLIMYVVHRYERVALGLAGGESA